MSAPTDALPTGPYYKFLRAGQRSPIGSGAWEPGVWRRVTGTLVPCRRALHACRAEDLVLWLSGPQLWTCEFATPPELHGSDWEDTKLYGRRLRILDRIEAWDERASRLFAADCAEHVLPVFEAARPGDARPRQALVVARRYADGAATGAELRSAAGAAWAAAGDAGAAARAAGAAARAAWADGVDAAEATERRWQTDALLGRLGLPPGAWQP